MNLLKNRIFKFIALVLSAIIVTSAVMGEVKKEAVEREISNKVLRLHIRAKSNSDDDQQIKLKVRDEILRVSENIISECNNKEECVEKIKENMDLIEKTAQKTVYENGKNDSVKVYLRNEIFPVRKYGKLVFPSGEYTAVAVEIGGGRGKNWWCVMFPKLCYIDESIVSENSDLKNIFTENEYNLITGEKKIKLAFKSAEIIEDLF